MTYYWKLRLRGPVVALIGGSVVAAGFLSHMTAGQRVMSVEQATVPLPLGPLAVVLPASALALTLREPVGIVAATRSQRLIGVRALHILLIAACCVLVSTQILAPPVGSSPAWWAGTVVALLAMVSVLIGGEWGLLTYLPVAMLVQLVPSPIPSEIAAWLGHEPGSPLSLIMVAPLVAVTALYVLERSSISESKMNN